MLVARYLLTGFVLALAFVHFAALTMIQPPSCPPECICLSQTQVMFFIYTLKRRSNFQISLTNLIESGLSSSIVLLETNKQTRHYYIKSEPIL
jgi:hypothetical protein